MFVPGHPSCRWGYRDHVTVHAAVKTTKTICPLCRKIPRNSVQCMAVFLQVQGRYVCSVLMAALDVIYIRGNCIIYGN